VQANLPSPIQEVQVLIRHVSTPLWGLINPIRQVVPLTSHIPLYRTHHSHLHLPSLSFLSTTPPSLQNTKLSHPSVSHHVMIMSRHQVQYTPSTYIHQVQHTRSTAYTKYSIHRRLFVFPAFSWLRVDPWIRFQLPVCLPTQSTAISQLSMRAQW